MPRTIDLIFTRDFSLPMSDRWQFLLSTRIREEFGASLDHQICYFNGRAAEFYRLREELAQLKRSVAAKPLSDYLFSEEKTNNFLTDVKRIKEIFKSDLPSLSEKRTEQFRQVVDLFSSLYSIYMLAVFLPNTWKEHFLSIHGEAGQVVVERMYKNRVLSEGTFEEVDVYLCKLGSFLLEQNNLKEKYSSFLRWTELEGLLKGSVANISNEQLAERIRGYILYGTKIFLNSDFRKFLQNNDLIYEGLDIDLEVKEIKGQVACSGGVLEGKVQVIMNVAEIKNFQSGNILVTSMTTPDYLPIMKQAKAIVTDEGGITCHAAIVSRELKVPCVIGTKIATRVLKDGDMIEVDATKGIVRKVSC